MNYPMVADNMASLKVHEDRAKGDGFARLLFEEKSERAAFPAATERRVRHVQAILLNTRSPVSRKTERKSKSQG